MCKTRRRDRQAVRPRRVEQFKTKRVRRSKGGDEVVMSQVERVITTVDLWLLATVLARDRYEP